MDAALPGQLASGNAAVCSGFTAPRGLTFGRICVSKAFGIAVCANIYRHAKRTLSARHVYFDSEAGEETVPSRVPSDRSFGIHHM